MKLQSALVIGEVKKFIDQGQPVILPVDGQSMRPFITGGREKVEFVPLPASSGLDTGLQPGDVVMAKVREGYHVVHRIVQIDGNRLVLEGDGNLGFKEHCLREDVVAQGINVVDAAGRKRSLTSPEARRRWRLWMRLKPLRRILLKALRLIGK